MITTETIRRDLREIRHYCSRKKVFDEAGERIGNNAVLDTLTKYNAAIRTAPLRLYEIYAGLYIDGTVRGECRLYTRIHPVAQYKTGEILSIGNR